jgi:hypothetical protein
MVVVWLLKWRLLPLLLLVEDLDIVLELYKPCSLPVNVLHSSFGTLSYYLPPYDDFLFFVEPLDLLLNPSQLFLLCSFIFRVFIFPVFYMDLLELDIAFAQARHCPG